MTLKRTSTISKIVFIAEITETEARRRAAFAGLIAARLISRFASDYAFTR